MVRLFVAGALCMALVTACAMGGKPASTSARAPETAPAVAGAQSEQTVMPADPRTEIEQRYAEIEKQRADLGLAEPQVAPSSSAATPMASVPLSTDATCKPAKTDTCTQSCTFSDSICKNAERICVLAADMKSEWAADKCASAKKTCESAHDKCCTCK